MIFQRQIEFIQSFEETLFKGIQDVVNDNASAIEEQITEVQLFDKGETGDGKKLQSYALSTIKQKIRKRQPFDRTTLRDTEKFHKSVTVTGNPLDLEVTADTPYTQFLIKRYSDRILVPSAEFLRDLFSKDLIPNIKNLMR